MASPIRLDDGASVAFLRRFHVESLRGGMNRLLLRAMPTGAQPERIEVLFQYVQYLDIPMTFDGLTIEDSTQADGPCRPWSETLLKFPECRVFRLSVAGRLTGRIVAAGCAYGEDRAVDGASSMFPMMGN